MRLLLITPGWLVEGHSPGRTALGESLGVGMAGWWLRSLSGLVWRMGAAASAGAVMA